MDYKVLIGVIATDYIRTKTTATLFSLAKMYPHIDLLVRQGCYLHKNREDVAKHAIKEGYSHIFFVDSDMCFAAEVLKRLLEDDKDIVGVHYNCRHLPLVSTVKITDDDGKLVAKTEEIPHALFKVHAVGTGCVLIKTSVFEKIEKPWFWYGDIDKPETYTGEDIWFCRQAAKAGIDTWVDGNLQVGHEGSYIY